MGQYAATPIFELYDTAFANVTIEIKSVDLKSPLHEKKTGKIVKA